MEGFGERNQPQSSSTTPFMEHNVCLRGCCGDANFGGPQVDIPKAFPLTSFHDLTTTSLDRMRYLMGFDNVVKEAQHWIDESNVMSIHPEWLFETTKKAKRGPYYDVLKTILDVDHELETVSVRKTVGTKIARDYREYEKSVNPTNDLISKLAARNIDIFTFIERKWCCPIANPPSTWTRTDDNIGLLEIKDYESWWNAIGKKTRNMVRKAEKEWRKSPSCRAQ